MLNVQRSRYQVTGSSHDYKLFEFFLFGQLHNFGLFDGPPQKESFFFSVRFQVLHLLLLVGKTAKTDFHPSWLQVPVS